jgi:hypothetical protein
LPAGIRQTGLQKSAAAAATVIVGPVRRHVDKIFFAHYCFYNKSQIFGHRISKAFADQLAGILNRKFDL